MIPPQPSVTSSTSDADRLSAVMTSDADVTDSPPSALHRKRVTFDVIVTPSSRRRRHLVASSSRCRVKRRRRDDDDDVTSLDNDAAVFIAAHTPL